MDKKTTKKIANCILFITLVNLPYLTITQQIGLDRFLDSFENPDYYQYTQEKILYPTDQTQSTSLILIQKASHPTFSIQTGDIVLCYDTYEKITYDQTNKLTKTHEHHFYYSTVYVSEGVDLIPGYHIIGKVIGVIEDNIWNAISLKTWEASIKMLNINALFHTE